MLAVECQQGRPLLPARTGRRANLEDHATAGRMVCGSPRGLSASGGTPEAGRLGHQHQASSPIEVLDGAGNSIPKPNLSKPGTPKQRFLYLLRGLNIYHTHQVWATDITYIPMPKGFFYLMAIRPAARLDLHSRYVLHWQLSNTLEADWCVAALQQSLRQWGKPQIFNTDQGSQFTSDSFIAVLQSHQIAISWDGKGRALDNIFVERF